MDRSMEDREVRREWWEDILNGQSMSVRVQMGVEREVQRKAYRVGVPKRLVSCSSDSSST